VFYHYRNQPNSISTYIAAVAVVVAAGRRRFSRVFLLSPQEIHTSKKRRQVLYTKGKCMFYWKSSSLKRQQSLSCHLNIVNVFL